VTAGSRAMPCAIGWHPWLRKPDDLEFQPDAMYPRDADGIAVLPLVDPTPPPWDDCFINHRPLLLRRDGQTLRLSANCRHWVIFDGLAHSTAIEPQSGPPNAFNLEPSTLQPGEMRSATFRWEWL
jgi:aldose 1-epimerase